MSKASKARFIITRIGSVGQSNVMHFITGHDEYRTACGRAANHTMNVNKERGILSVDCGTCWKIKRAKAGA